MQTKTIDYFFWTSSVWTYLGHKRFLDLVAQTGAKIRFRPVRKENLLASAGGAVVGPLGAPRLAYHSTELARWTRRLSIKINAKPHHLPNSEEKALRLLAAADEEGRDIGMLADAIMRALWVEDRDIADEPTLIEIASSVGFEPKSVSAWMANTEAATILDHNAEAALSAGVFGAPSYLFNDEIFWGQDRLGQLSEALTGQGAVAGFWRGRLSGIFTAEMGGVEMESLQDVIMQAGVGLEGDRYATEKGYYSEKPHADRQVTLIESETLEALKRDHGIALLPEETRRNLITQGVPLNHLVGRRFRVGEVELYGGLLNVPCMYLERLLDRKVFEPLINRSGLNCRILNTGRVHVGDAIVPVG